MHTRGVAVGWIAAVTVVLSRPAGAEPLRYKFKPGARRETRISMAAATLVGLPGSERTQMQFRMVVRQVQRVRAVSGGVATLETLHTPVSGKVTANGETTAMPADARAPTRAVVKVTDRGRQVSTNAGPGLAMAGSPLGALESLYGAVFPVREVRPGDTWTETLTLGTGPAAERVTLNCRHDGKATALGRPCVRILTQFTVSRSGGSRGGPSALDEAASGGKVMGKITTYFDPAAGVEIYTTGVVTLVTKIDLSGLGPEGGEFVTAMKVNYVQSLVGAGTPKGR